MQEARQALDGGMVPEAVAKLRNALALWRGPVLAGNCGSVIAAASAVLEERMLAATGQLAELRLAMGETEELIGDLRELTSHHPLRESFRGQLMLALHRAGRQAEALAEYAAIRRLLAEELGIDPGKQLSTLHEAILRGSPDLALPGPSRQPHAPTALHPLPARQAPCTLPYDLTDFTGRDRELQLLIGQAGGQDAGTVRIVAIDGMGGCGKTALAVHAAHRLAEAYPDGRIHADLRGFTPEEEPRRPGAVIGSLLKCLSVPAEHIPEGLDDRVALWRATLAERRILLLLDNASDAAQVRPLLPASSGCLVLITSRNRLVGLDGAVSLSLGIPSAAEARALVTEALGAERAAKEPEAVDALVELCGRLPLALRIAATRLRSRPQWTVQHLVDRLRHSSRRLDELRSGDRSVEETLWLSYRALDDEHRKSFRLLARHSGAEIGASTAAALLGTRPHTAENVLEHLMDMHLVEQHEIGRYAFHDLVRGFAQRLPEPEALLRVPRPGSCVPASAG
ncbi:BTAD domain-containing putative transcriptional regulator [Streptomyces roseofulvus]|uniref:BTAD domain-containing putative transcriptional regulator n=1 Tax=Streptomyces roseofulvus TaxID=33902 RepID=UPI0031FCD698